MGLARNVDEQQGSAAVRQSHFERAVRLLHLHVHHLLRYLLSHLHVHHLLWYLLTISSLAFICYGIYLLSLH